MELLLGGRGASRELKDRFEAGYMPIPETGCWWWIAAASSAGYGQLWADGKVKYAHRVSYEMHIGEIPDGLFVCHHCDNPGCVNPEHLFVGTHTDNMHDMFRKSRRGTTVYGQTHGMSKLTEDDVREIILDSRSQRAIAADFGIHQTNVSLIKRRKAWAHVEVN